jgi:molybdate transport system substrate-binding protein
MATKQVLAELSAAYAASAGRPVKIESVGGVDAAKRVRDGESFDIVVLAEDVIGKLVAEGCCRAGSATAVARSPVAIAVPEGAALPDISSEDAVRRAVAQARTIGFSTGPSGTYLTKLFEQWGLADALAGRLVKAQPGVPVASLIARGEVALGFQQLSELLGAPGVRVVGLLPEPIQLVTTFTGAVGAKARDAAGAAALLAFLASPAADAAKRRNGME